MTDHEINRAVAEARGWTPPETLYGLAHYPDGLMVRPEPVPAVCTDPAAWGALLEWLAEQGRSPRLAHDEWEDHGLVWYALVFGPGAPAESQPFEVFDPLPGRALALAFLKAVQP
jgi:hypothetical protein